MGFQFQRTLRKAVTLRGIGLHSGQLVGVTLRPAQPGKGIVFVRTDLSGAPEIPARFANIVSTQLATTLGIGSVSVATVEHLMAALQGKGIDNLIVEVNAPEIPILDGSSAPFCEAIDRVGIESSRTKRPLLVLRKKVELKVGEKWAVAEPSGKFEVHGSIEFDHPCIGYQEFKYVEGKTSFDELASARTFCFLQDVEAMKRAGLARGGSLDNAVVMDETSVLNAGGLRFTDEFARHKVLDALGDFKLAGVDLQAFVRLHRAGHDLHGQLLAAIFANPDNYELIHANVSEEPVLAPIRAVPARAFA